MPRRTGWLALLLAAALPLLSGCAAVGKLLEHAHRIPLENKLVSEKSEPNVLIARDGTTCMVPQARWEEAEVGERYLCLWR